MHNKDPEYLRTLDAWLSSADWHTMLTLSNSSHFPPEWFFIRLDKLQKLFLNRYHMSMEWAASVEQTKNGINHCHALVRFPRVYGRVGDRRLKCGSAVFPSDWQDRQKAGTLNGKRKMISYVFRRLLGPEIQARPQVQNCKEGLQLLRKSEVDPFDYMKFWYQGNYGAIADCEPIRNQGAVVSYALKYATKEITTQSLRWSISSGAVPTGENISDDTLPLRSQPPEKRQTTSRSGPPWS